MINKSKNPLAIRPPNISNVTIHRDSSWMAADETRRTNAIICITYVPRANRFQLLFIHASMRMSYAFRRNSLIKIQLYDRGQKKKKITISHSAEETSADMNLHSIRHFDLKIHAQARPKVADNELVKSRCATHMHKEQSLLSITSNVRAAADHMATNGFRENVSDVQHVGARHISLDWWIITRAPPRLVRAA